MAERFAINGKYLGQPQSGVQRVAAELTRALDDLAGPHAEAGAISFRILRPPGSRPAEVSHIPQAVVGAGSGALWEQFSLPRHTRGDVLLNLCNMAPVTARGDVIVIHDAQAFLAPKSYSLAFRTWYRAVIPLLASRARRVVTVSNYSKDQLAAFGVAPLERISVIYNGVDHISRIDSDAAVLDRLGLRAKTYVATLSNTQHHKNIGVLFEAFRSPQLAGVPLLLVGGAQPADFESQGLSPPPNAVFTGRVSDGELKSLIEHAAVFAFPSRTEGFGLPPLEAMLLGTPVLIAPCGAMPEVCGDAALYAAPDRPAEWAATLVRLLEDLSLLHTLSQRGRLQAARYRWSDSARRVSRPPAEVLMGSGLTNFMRRLPLICGVVCLGLTGAMAISTWSSTSSPICGPPCQDARFTRAVNAQGGLDDARRARAAVEAKLAMSPFDTGAWLRLALLEAGGYRGSLNAPSIQALENSYRLAPVDVGFSHWRLAYAFNHWEELSPGLRQSAAAEGRMTVLAGEPVIRALEADITDPAGKLAFRFLVMNTAR